MQSTKWMLVASVLLGTIVPACSMVCDPRSAQMTCLEGCLTCREAYGGDLYDMVACCRDCRATQLPLIDYGPASCSHKYVRNSWLKRFGK